MENENEVNVGWQQHWPEHNWATFAPCFLGLFPYIPHDQAPHECRWNLGESLKETVSNYQEAETGFVKQTEDVIRTLCDKGSASAASEAVAYFLGLRSAVLESFFLKFSIGTRNGRSWTIIPFPTLPTHNVIEWFLIDWWRRHGAFEVAAFRYIEVPPGE